MEYEDIDFNQLYIQRREKTSFKPKKSADWDKKAESMNSKVHKSIYNDLFIKHINLEGIETLLDVGCGVGNLSIKLASKLKEVYSMDYSPVMLDFLKETMEKESIKNITPIYKSWYDSWDDIPNADLVIASRSMEVSNMKEALEKLNDKANKRVVISYKTDGSFISENILDVLQREIIQRPTYIYILNILYSMGINASVNFIKSEGRNSYYASKEDFVKSVYWNIGSLSDDEVKRLENYYIKNDLKNKIEQEYVPWAVISWDKI